MNVVEPNSQTWVSDRAVCYLWVANTTVKRVRYFMFVELDGGVSLYIVGSGKALCG